MASHAYVVGLGSNLGSRAFAIAAATTLIDARDDTQVLARSRLYASPALTLPGARAQPDYLNAAIAVRSELAPEAFLRALLAIEAALGRVRRERWGARVIDLDLLWGEHSVATDTLVLPHPELPKRGFALAPLLDVAPALGAETNKALHARYAPALKACPAPPRVVGGYDPEAFTIERSELGEAVTRQLRASGPLEDAVAQLLAGAGMVVATELRGPPSCTPFGAYVAMLDVARDLEPIERLRALATEVVERVQSGLQVSGAVVGAQLASARLICAPSGGPAASARRVAVEAIALDPLAVTRDGPQVRAGFTLVFSKLGDLARDSLS